MWRNAYLQDMQGRKNYQEKLFTPQAMTGGVSPYENVKNTSKSRPALICGNVNTLSIGQRVAHELMHGQDLRDVNDNTNIMHFNTSVNIGDLPFRFKDLTPVITGTSTLYEQQIFVTDDPVDWQRGFVYNKEGEELFKILVDDEAPKLEKLKEYLFGKDYDEIKSIFINNSALTPDEIKEVRGKIVMLKDEDQKKELYLELQQKVPYHNQRNNDQTQYIADRMCNLTSQAMCLEYLGISCPDPNMQFEDYLEQIRADNNYGDRTTSGTRQKVAEYLGACYSKEDYGRTFSEEKEEFKKFALNKLESGCAIMLSVWPSCKGHLVRLQKITNEGIIVDDPYGKVKGKKDGFDWREECNSGGYDANSNTFEDTKGNDNLWKWSDIQDVTLKYVEAYCKCE